MGDRDGISHEECAQRAGCGVATVGRYARAGWLTRLPNGRLSPVAVGEVRARMQNDGHPPTHAKAWREGVIADLEAAVIGWRELDEPSREQAVELVRLTIIRADLMQPDGWGVALEEAIERIAEPKARRLLFATTTRGPSRTKEP